MSDFGMSMTALEIDGPQLRATQLVTRPGTLPTIAVAMTAGVAPDLPTIWEYLCEPAEFFGVPMPSVVDLAAAISAVADVGPGGVVFAVDVTIAELNGTPQILVSRTPVVSARSQAVRIASDDSLSQPHRDTDPWWQRMAARTTSKAGVDRLERWLNGRGFADALADGVPLLGAVVLQVDGAIVGIENPEPTSILEQLAHCGAISAIELVAARPADADRAWWISPRYETHPVGEIDGVRFPIDEVTVAPFARWS